MKTIILTLLMILFTFNTNSQNIEVVKDELLLHQSIINYDNKTQIELYAIVKLWIAQTYKSAKDVIQLDDSINGIIILKGINEYNVLFKKVSISYKSFHNIKIEIKDNKIRITIEIIDIKNNLSNSSVDGIDLFINPITEPNLDNKTKLKAEHILNINTFNIDILNKLKNTYIKEDNW